MNSKIIMTMFVATVFLVLWSAFYAGVMVFRKWGLIASSSLLHYVLIGVSIALPIIFIVTMAIGNTSWSSLNSLVYTVVSVWPAIVSWFFIASFAFGLLSVVFPRIPLASCGIATIAMTVVLTVASIICANRPTTRSVFVPSNEILSPLSGKRIALVADLHIGMTRGQAFLERVVGRIMAEKPDIIVIAGDLIDGPIIPYETYLEPLSRLSAPLGVYFTPGNHEQYNRENNKFYAAVPKNITVVTDATTQIPGASGATVLGIDYRSESETDMLDRVGDLLQEKPTITILHDPKNRDILRDKTGLVLSGHTHGGQMFPANILVWRLYREKMRGLVSAKPTSYYTTVGIGTSVVPARLGARPEVVILEIE